MAHSSLDPATDLPPEQVPPTTTSDPRELREAARAHAKAAMLAEFNGRYALARRHRETARRLRDEAARHVPS